MVKEKKLRVFVDASVLIAGILSNQGASRAIVNLGREGVLDLVITEEIIKEVYISVKNKYPDIKYSESLYQVISGLKKCIQKNPDWQETNQFTGLISDHNDRYVLAGAYKYKVNTLVTLDRKHFFTDDLNRANLPFTIQLPGDFMKIYRTNFISDKPDTTPLKMKNPPDVQ